MEMYHLMLWIVFPYSVAAIVGMGLIWQLDVPIGAGDKAISKTKPITAFLLRVLLLLSTLSGFWMLYLSEQFVQLLLWLLSLIQFNPDMDLILNSSIIFQVHFIFVFLFFLLLAFTNKVRYLLKPHLCFKSLLSKFE